MGTDRFDDPWAGCTRFAQRNRQPVRFEQFIECYDKMGDDRFNMDDPGEAFSQPGHGFEDETSSSG